MRATRAPGHRPARRPNAWSALIVTAFLTALLCAWTRAPAGWLLTERVSSIARDGPLGAASSGFATTLPLGELAQRGDLLAFLLVVATSMAATWTGHVLYRGRARWLAAVTSGGLSAVALLHWLHETDFFGALPGLVSALFTILSVTALVRSLVHVGRVTPLAAAHAMGAASVVALLDPPWGIPLVGVLALMSWLRSPRQLASRTMLAWLVGLAPATTLALVLAPGMLMSGTLASSWPLLAALGLGLPPLELLEQHLPQATLYPALALIVLLVTPLRWRGGLLLVVLATAALVIQLGERPLCPVPALLVLLCVATAGWVWLAGTVWPRRPRLDAVQAIAATLVVAALAYPRVAAVGLATAPLAEERPMISVARLFDEALITPGVVLLVHDPWLHHRLHDRRTLEHWRPDILLTDAMAIDDADILAASTAWRAEGRIVLSDSFDAASRWPVQWVSEAGPLFAFVGPEVRDELESDDEDTTIAWRRPHPEEGERSLIDRWRIVRLSLERARFHRAAGDPVAALEALELMPARHRALETRLLLARSVRPHAGVGSELPAASDVPTWLRTARAKSWSDTSWAEGAWIEAALAAEAGDLLYAHGEQERAAQLLAEAAAEGYRPAWGALARWQLRAGEDDAARTTLHAMTSDPDLRAELLDVVEWLLARERIVEAREILESIPEGQTPPLGELTTRLLMLRAVVSPATYARGD